MNTPVNFQSIPRIQALFGSSAKQYRKAQVTLARLPQPEEVGQVLVTYVSAPTSEKGYVVETETVIEAGKVITRNINPVHEADGIYNEWQQDVATFQKNYGAEPTSTEFVPYRRKGLLNAIEIDDEVLALLQSANGATATIAVSWGGGSMEVYKGGLLADAGYGVAVEERDTYELVSD
jgi:hypothetical protein